MSDNSEARPRLPITTAIRPPTIPSRAQGTYSRGNPEPPRAVRMALGIRFWPERVSLFLWVLIFASLIIFGRARAPDGGHRVLDDWLDALLVMVGTTSPKILLPLWLVMRAFHALFISPLRNRI
jgi:hypothetical protein